MGDDLRTTANRTGFEPPEGVVAFGATPHWGYESPSADRDSASQPPGSREPGRSVSVEGEGFEPPRGGRRIESRPQPWELALLAQRDRGRTGYREAPIPLSFGADPQPPAQLATIGAYVPGEVMPAAPVEFVGPQDPSGNSIASLFLGMLSFVCCAGCVLSIPTYLLARSELRRIGEGRASRAGEIYAQAALALAITSFVVSSIVFGLCGTMWVMAFVEDLTRNRY